MGGGIFISYRREDTRHAAGRLYQHLSNKFGEERIFIDVDAIAPGIDFTAAISDRVTNCDALLALIGPDWVYSQDNKGGRRLDDPNDFVRLEIKEALKRGVRVIPVLIDDTQMPSAAELPEDLQSLAKRNAVRLVHARFASDADHVVQTLMRDLGIPLVTDSEIGSKGQLPVAALTGLLLVGGAGGFLLGAAVGAFIVESFARLGNSLGEVYAESPHIWSFIAVVAVLGITFVLFSSLCTRLRSRVWRALTTSMFFAAGMILIVGVFMHSSLAMLGSDNATAYGLVLGIVATIIAAVPLIKSVAR